MTRIRERKRMNWTISLEILGMRNGARKSRNFADDSSQQGDGGRNDFLQSIVR